MLTSIYNIHILDSFYLKGELKLVVDWLTLIITDFNFNFNFNFNNLLVIVIDLIITIFISNIIKFTDFIIKSIMIVN